MQRKTNTKFSAVRVSFMTGSIIPGVAVIVVGLTISITSLVRGSIMVLLQALQVLAITGRFP